MGIENELDKLVQKWAYSQRSAINGEMPCVGHHYYSRRHTLLRWDLKNIIPVTERQHRLIHDGKIIYKSPHHDYLSYISKINFKDWLFQHNLTEKEFIVEKLNELRRLVK